MHSSIRIRCQASLSNHEHAISQSLFPLERQFPTDSGVWVRTLDEHVQQCDSTRGAVRSYILRSNLTLGDKHIADEHAAGIECVSSVFDIDGWVNSRHGRDGKSFGKQL